MSLIFRFLTAFRTKIARDVVVFAWNDAQINLFSQTLSPFSCWALVTLLSLFCHTFVTLLSLFCHSLVTLLSLSPHSLPTLSSLSPLYRPTHSIPGVSAMETIICPTVSTRTWLFSRLTMLASSLTVWCWFLMSSPSNVKNFSSKCGPGPVSACYQWWGSK